MTLTSTALVADDHDLSRLALSGILTGRLSFARVLEADGLDGALALLGEQQCVHLALLDLDMPGMAGATSLSAIRRVFPDTLLAVVSGSTRRADILDALTAGAHAYVPKTLRVDEIAAVLARVVAGEVYVPPVLAVLPPEQEGDPRPAVDAVTIRTGTIADPWTGGEPSMRLTGRQAQILDLLRRGLSNKEIARDLNVAAGTVKVHVSLLLKALGAPNRAAAAAIGASAPRQSSTGSERLIGST